jgi:hypothetical protein
MLSRDQALWLIGFMRSLPGQASYQAPASPGFVHPGGDASEAHAEATRAAVSGELDPAMPWYEDDGIQGQFEPY